MVWRVARQTALVGLVLVTATAAVANGADAAARPSGAASTAATPTLELHRQAAVAVRLQSGNNELELHQNIEGVQEFQGGASANVPLKMYIQLGSLPWGVAANEMCATQALDMAFWMVQQGYTLYRQVAHIQRPLISGCGDFGVSVWTIGQWGWEAHPFAHQVGGDEQRGLACSLGGLFGPAYWFCSGHLYWQNDWDAWFQFEDYYDAVAWAVFLGTPVAWTGDTYLVPSQILWLSIIFGSGFSYTTTVEADGCGSGSGTDWTHGSFGGQKIDHVFGTATTSCTVEAVEFPFTLTPPLPSGLADHKLVGGYITP